MNNNMMSKDVSNITRIQGTNDNSILSKCSMIKYGYFDDEYLPHMIGKFSRRAPLINRGYYIRAKSIEYTLLNFIEYCHDKEFQIISLGAGFDTSFFRLTKQNKLEKCIFIEMDYFDVAQRKARLMEQEPKLWNCLKNPDNVSLVKDNYIMINAANYKLIGIDLTKLDILEACIRASGISYDLPTLFLSECVITYISTKKSSNLLKFIAKSFPTNCFVLYEQIYPDDSFGKFMCLHFKQLGSSLRGIATYKNQDDQIQRFLRAGWDHASSCDMTQFYYEIISSAEKFRIENLEVFDEYEEWLLKCNHYMVLVACKGMDWNPRIARCTSELRYDEMSPKVVIPLDIKVYQSDDTESFKAGGIKTHYVKADLIDSALGHECLLRVSGYGQNPFSSGHCRLCCVSVLDLETNVMTHIVPQQSELLLNSLCGSMSKLSSNTFILFGGRSSPLKPNNITTKLVLCSNAVTNGWQAQCLELSTSDSPQKPSPRWRHQAGIYWITKQPYLFIYGGRNSNPSPLSDTHVLNFSSDSWQQLHVKSPPPLCSASVASIGTESSCVNESSDQCCGCCCLLMFGGLLGPDLIPSGDLWRWCGRQAQWTKIDVSGSIVPRFSHTTHVRHRETETCGAKTVLLISLGGVSHKIPFVGMTVISIDLIHNSAQYVDVTLDTSNGSECTMVHNHGSALSEKSQKIWVVGGGGNCFSFGTQLNENIYSVDITGEIFHE